MLRKVIGVLASALLVGALASSPALGHGGGKTVDDPPPAPHEDIPTDAADFATAPEGECVVTGQVHVDDENDQGGVAPDEFNHNHYRFVDALITCESATNEFLSDTFNVIADGGTDGGVPGAPDVDPHGENDSIGWSHSDKYDTGEIAAKDSGDAASCDARTPDDENKGDIWVQGQNSGEEASGWVKFVREGGVVEAYGCLGPDDTTQGDIFFQAELTFQPTDDPGEKVQNAILRGAAVVDEQGQLP